MFITLCHRTLHTARVFLSLQQEPEAFLKDASRPLADPIEPDREITKARQLLLIYYLLKAGFDMEHRSDAPISAVARLAHVMTGTRFTNLQNSDIYKMYAEMPYYKKGEPLIGDLRFIRPYFEELHIEKAVHLIDEGIQRAIKELPLKDRKNIDISLFIPLQQNGIIP